MIIVVVICDDVEEFRYPAENVPAIGDRIVSDYTGYRVTDRTWRLDEGIVELWTEKE